MIDNSIQTLLDLGAEAQITTRKSNNTTSQNNKIKRIKYNQTCPRFATMDHLRITGLGNKITEVIFGMILAERTNATYIYDEDIWHYAGSHGDYAWFPAGFLPLQNVEVTQQDLNRWKKEQVQLQVHEEKIQRRDGTWDQVIESSRNISCHVEFHTRFDQCCSTDASESDSNNNTSNYHHHHPNYCFCTMSKSLNGAFESIKWRLREVYYSQSNYTAPKDLSELLPQYNNNNNNISNALIPPRIVTIVWHIRVGDVVLHRGKIDYFERIFAQIKESFEKANNHKHQQHNRNVTQIIPHIFFLGEGGKDIILQSFPFLPEMCRKYIYSSNSESINIKQDIIDPNPCSYPVMDVRETLYHMIHSNILITSGSSFASVAALLRINDNNSTTTTTSSMSTTGIDYNKQLITLDALPKEGEEARGIYSVSESLQIDQEGNIQQIELLETLLEKWD